MSQAEQNTMSLAGLVVFRELFVGKWRLAILQELLIGPKRLSELRRTLPLSSKKVLIDTLQALVRLGWIERIEYPGRTKRVEYRLAQTFAPELSRVLVDIKEREMVSRQLQKQTESSTKQ